MLETLQPAPEPPGGDQSRNWDLVAYPTFVQWKDT